MFEQIIGRTFERFICKIFGYIINRISGKFIIQIFDGIIEHDCGFDY
jgi:hypothetical protein